MGLALNNEGDVTGRSVEINFTPKWLPQGAVVPHGLSMETPIVCLSLCLYFLGKLRKVSTLYFLSLLPCSPPLTLAALELHLPLKPQPVIFASKLDF